MPHCQRRLHWPYRYTLGAWTVQAADIIQTAEQYGRFTGFLHLLEAAGMVEVLEGQGALYGFRPGR